MTAEEYVDWEQCRRDRRNTAYRSQFTDSDVPPLAYACALNRSVMTSYTPKRHLRCLDGEITKCDDELFLSETSTLSPAHIISGRGRTARGPGGSREDQPRVAGDYQEASS